MKIKNILGLKLFGLVVLSLLLAVNCAEKGTDPDTNIPPNTFVAGYQIELAPDSATHYNALVSWRGSDQDGAIYWYYWRVFEGADTTGDSLYIYEADSVGVDTINISTWQATYNLNTSLRLNYPTFNQTYFFQVRAQDNDQTYDPSPAGEIIAIDRIRDFNYAPNTEIVSGPPDGAITGQGIHFIIKGIDIDGVVDTIEYKVDTDTVWTKVAADVTTHDTEINIRGLTTGGHSIAFRCIDNFRLTDPSPVSRSVVVVDNLAPELTLSVSDGQSFIVPYTEPTIEEMAITFTANVSFYYSAIDSFVIITSSGDTINTADAEIILEDLGAGNYWIDVTAYDIGGNSTSSSHVNFSIVELAAGDGVLCVNGVDWESYGQAGPMWDDGVPWGNREHFKCWDLFDTTPLGSVPVFADSLLGFGTIPEWMFDTTFFDAISWFGNNYSGDFAYWEEREDAIMAYLEMGGNILLPVRYGSDWFFDDLTEYCTIVDGSWLTGLDPDFLTAKVDILTDITVEQAQSLWEIPMTSGSNVTWIYEAATVAAGKHAGFVVLPNGDGGGGAFCYIAGRSYRWDNASLKANVDVILETYFGIEN